MSFGGTSQSFPKPEYLEYEFKQLGSNIATYELTPRPITATTSYEHTH